MPGFTLVVLLVVGLAALAATNFRCTGPAPASAPWLDSSQPLATFDALGENGREDILLAGNEGTLESYSGT
jgi:hypothetical protein